jgi:hypothetical protein
MLVAASTQTTSIISLKRSTSTNCRGCGGRPNTPSDAILVVAMSLGGADHTGLKEFEFTSAVHLAFDELELGDLAFGLAVRPG